MVLTCNFMGSLQGIMMKNTGDEVRTGQGLDFNPLTSLLGDISNMSNISVSHFFTFKKVAITMLYLFPRVGVRTEIILLRILAQKKSS